ncbi:MAG: toll/interleukin-1 receptor domain-containing protein, partial [Chloroflexota bacterium]
MIDIFISHSGDDSELAKMTVDLIRAAYNISPKKIRCTSVDGYRLPTGINFNDRLRAEAIESTAFIALLSKSAMQAVYVVFELGARWAAQKPMLPLLVPDESFDVLEGPIADLNVMDMSSEGQLLQFVEDLGTALNLQPNSTSSYMAKIKDITNYMSPSRVNNINATSQFKTSGNSSPNPQDSLDDNTESILRQHCSQRHPNNFELQAYCQQKQREAAQKLKQGSPKNIPKPIFNQIRSDAAAKYPTNFELRAYTEQKQVDAYLKLNPINSPLKISSPEMQKTRQDLQPKFPIRQQFTELDQDEFLENSYNIIVAYFKSELNKLESRYDHIQVKLR